MPEESAVSTGGVKRNVEAAELALDLQCPPTVRRRDAAFWDQDYGLIRRWYISENKAMKEVVTLLKQHWADDKVTVKQLDYHLKRWGLYKNFTESQVYYIHNTVRDRAEQGKKSAIVMAGQLHDDIKMIRAKNRHILPSMPFRIKSSEIPVEDPRIIITTPPPSPTLRSCDPMIYNLPWTQLSDWLCESQLHIHTDGIDTSSFVSRMMAILSVRKLEFDCSVRKEVLVIKTLTEALNTFMPETRPNENFRRACALSHLQGGLDTEALKILIYCVSNNLVQDQFGEFPSEQFMHLCSVLGITRQHIIRSLFDFAETHPTVQVILDRMFRAAFKMAWYGVISVLLRENERPEDTKNSQMRQFPISEALLHSIRTSDVRLMSNILENTSIYVEAREASKLLGWCACIDDDTTAAELARLLIHKWSLAFREQDLRPVLLKVLSSGNVLLLKLLDPYVSWNVQPCTMPYQWHEVDAGFPIPEYGWVHHTAKPWIVPETYSIFTWVFWRHESLCFPKEVDPCDVSRSQSKSLRMYEYLQKHLGMSTQKATLSEQRFRGDPLPVQDMLITASARGFNDFLKQSGCGPSELNASNKLGMWPLCAASIFGMASTCLSLIQDLGADPNYYPATETKLRYPLPLHQATFYGHRATVRVLLEHGADPHCKCVLYRYAKRCIGPQFPHGDSHSDWSATPLEIAIKKGRWDVALTLMEYIKNVSESEMLSILFACTCTIDISDSGSDKEDTDTLLDALENKSNTDNASKLDGYRQPDLRGLLLLRKMLLRSTWDLSSLVNSPVAGIGTDSLLESALDMKNANLCDVLASFYEETDHQGLKFMETTKVGAQILVSRLLRGVGPEAGSLVVQRRFNIALCNGWEQIANDYAQAGAQLYGACIVEAFKTCSASFLSKRLLDHADLDTLRITDDKGRGVLESAVLSLKPENALLALSILPDVYESGALCQVIRLVYMEGYTAMLQVLDELLQRRKMASIERMCPLIENTLIGMAARHASVEFVRSLLSRTWPLQLSIRRDASKLDKRKQWNHLHRTLSTNDFQNTIRPAIKRLGHPAFIARDRVPRSQLSLPLLQESDEIIGMLLDKGYRPDAASVGLAVESGMSSRSRGLLKRLVSLCPEIDAMEYHRTSSVLYVASLMGDSVALQMVLHQVAELSENYSRDRYPSTVLKSAIRATSTGRYSHEVLELLLKAGVEVNAPASPMRGATALQIAAITGNFRAARTLIEHGAEVNAMRAVYGGRTCLEGAAEHGRLDMVAYLLAEGAEIHGRGRLQYIRAVRFALRGGHVAVADFLKSRGGWKADDELRSEEEELCNDDIAFLHPLEYNLEDRRRHRHWCWLHSYWDAIRLSRDEEADGYEGYRPRDDGTYWDGQPCSTDSDRWQDYWFQVAAQRREGTESIGQYSRLVQENDEGNDHSQLEQEDIDLEKWWESKRSVHPSVHNEGVDFWEGNQADTF